MGKGRRVERRGEVTKDGTERKGKDERGVRGAEEDEAPT